MAVFHKISTNDGESMELTLNLGALFELSKKDKALTDRYFELQRQVQKDPNSLTEFDMGEFLYIAYRCAHVKDEDYLEYGEFLYKLTDSRQEMGEVFRKLYGAQEKKQGSPMPSGKRHGKK
jgi:hypothetical protein